METLKIYVLERDHDYDEYDGCTVLAISEEEAKLIAKEQTGENDWKVDKVEEINRSKYISASFHHG